MSRPLGFVEVGDGPPLLAVHGAVTGGRLTYEAAAPTWGLDRRVVVVDRPGFERTPGPGVRVPEQAARLVATAREVGGGAPIDALGGSFGGLVLLHAVQQDPEAFRSLVIVESAAIDLCPPDMVQAQAVVRLAREAWTSLGDAPEPAQLAATFRDVFATLDPSLTATIDTLLRRGEPGVRLLRDDLAVWQAMLDRHQLAESVAGRRTIPLLAVSGTTSHPGFQTFGRCTAAALHGRHVVVEGAGHAVHLHPGFGPVLADFLAEVDELHTADRTAAGGGT